MRFESQYAGNDTVDFRDPKILSFGQREFKTRARPGDRKIIADDRIGLPAGGIGRLCRRIDVARVKAPDLKKVCFLSPATQQK